MDRAAVQTARQHDLLDRCRKSPLDHALLRQIADLVPFQAVAELHFSAVERFQSEQTFYKRTLAGAVLADNAEIIVLLNAEAQILLHGQRFIAQDEIFTGNIGHSAQSLLDRIEIFPHQRLIMHTGIKIDTRDIVAGLQHQRLRTGRIADGIGDLLR